MKTAITSSFEERALALLGSGIAPVKVADALGVDPSRISQLLSEDSFKTKLADVRYQNLSKHNTADEELDNIESKLRAKIADTIDTVYKPMELTRMLQVVNAAKRRGASTPESIVEQAQIINLTIPVKIINKLTTNANNQVVRAGAQDLITIQSGTLASKLASSRDEQPITIISATEPAAERGSDSETETVISSQ